MTIIITKELLEKYVVQLEPLNNKPSLYLQGMDMAMQLLGAKIQDMYEDEIILSPVGVYAELITENKNFRDGFYKLTKKR